MSRGTKDFDIWVDPLPSVEAWAESLCSVLIKYSNLKPLRIGNCPGTWDFVQIADILKVGREDGLLRIEGADCPIDVFYVPNELESFDFEGVWERGKPLKDGTRLMEPIDLIVTKQLTERKNDEMDVRFLEDKIEREYSEKLRRCSIEEATSMFSRFATPGLAAVAVRQGLSDEVRALGWKILREMGEAGDPFARELLEELGHRE